MARRRRQLGAPGDKYVVALFQSYSERQDVATKVSKPLAAKAAAKAAVKFAQGAKDHGTVGVFVANSDAPVKGRPTSGGQWSVSTRHELTDRSSLMECRSNSYGARAVKCELHPTFKAELKLPTKKRR